MDLYTGEVYSLVLVFCILGCYGDGDRFCAYSPPPENKEGSDGSFLDTIYIAPNEMVKSDNKTVRCQHQGEPCFSLWGIDTSKNNESYIIQGCWKKSSECIFGSECISIWGPNSPRARSNNNTAKLKLLFNNTHFCCCYGDMCNVNMSTNQTLAREMEIIRPPEEDGLIPVSNNYKQLTIIISLSSVMAVAIMIMFSYLIYRKLCLHEESKLPDDPVDTSMYLVKSPSTPSFDLDQLQLNCVVNKGRYGEVWQGTLNDMDVAIKLFTANQRSYFLNERDIYLLPHMDHESLLTFYGAEERVTVEGDVQYLLVMSYVPQGTLTSYLKNNSLDWSILCKMGHSITSGLAYLHSEVIRGDGSKPAIAHRDLNSRNVLVTEELGCCICDFGFAMKIKRCNLFRNGAEENVEQAALTDVGTLLYMAPEVLEGAVNLRDCESSLKQIDVYALGLVLWELASRCSDLYQGMPLPDYKLPYQAEIGLRPTFQEMQLLVTKNKDRPPFRPTFPDVWKDTNLAIRALKETIEDCWDPDGEARLTALCVEERIIEMMTIWGHQHKGITPTFLTSSLVPLENRTEVQHNIMCSHEAPMLAGDHTVCVHHPAAGCYGNLNLAVDLTQMNEPVNELSEAAARRSQRQSYTDNSISAASTVDTTLSPSELDDPILPGKADCNVIYAQNKTVLQPHQGQNPTVERNTHKCSDEDVTVMGNTLVKGEPVVPSMGGSSATSRNRIPNTTVALSDEFLGAFSDNLESSLVQHDVLNDTPRHQSAPAPQPGIPYLQNQVRTNPSTSEPLIVRPKQPNVPGNGSRSSANQHYEAAPSNLNHPNNTQKPANWFGKFRKSRGEKDQNKNNPNLQSLLPDTEKESSKLNFPMFFGKRTSNSSSSLSAESSSSSSRTSLPGSHVPTEVRLVNGLHVVRPSTLAIHSSTSSGSFPYDQHSNIIRPAPNGTAAELPLSHLVNNPFRGDQGAAKLPCPGSNGNAAYTGHAKTPSQSSMDLTARSRDNACLGRPSSSNIQLSDLESNGRVRRPKSLSVCSLKNSGSTSTNHSMSNMASPTLL